MNSSVSVEDQELNCETPNSFVVSSSQICEGSWTDHKDSSEQDSIDQSVDSLLLCLPVSESSSSETSIPIEVSEGVRVSIDSDANFISLTDEHAETGISVDLECLPILMDCSNSENLKSDSAVVKFDKENLPIEGGSHIFNSDSDSCDSFGGFLSDTSTGLGNLKSVDSKDFSENPSEKKTLKEKLHLLSVKNKKEKFRKGKGLKASDLKLTKPTKDSLGLELHSSNSPSHQNNSKSSIRSLCNSSFNKLEKETNEASGKHKRESQKENMMKQLINVSPIPKIDLIKTTFKNSDDWMDESDLYLPREESLYRSSSEESFEGFFSSDMRVSHYYINKFNNDVEIFNALNNDANDKVHDTPSKGYKSGNRRSSTTKRMSHNSSNQDIEEDESDFIGQYCQKVGCTISWLESGDVKAVPVKINNGIVYELHEFAKSIDWEQQYIIQWIRRLEGIDTELYEDEDLKKITSIYKRRKAIVVNFYGRLCQKSKLEKFDNEVFNLSVFNIEKLPESQLDELNTITSANSEIISNNSKVLRTKINIEETESIKENFDTSEPVLTPDVRDFKCKNLSNEENMNSSDESDHHNDNEEDGEDSVNKEDSEKSVNKEDSEKSVNKEDSEKSVNKEDSEKSVNKEDSEKSVNKEDSEKSVNKEDSEKSVNKEDSEKSVNKEDSEKSVNKEVSEKSVNKEDSEESVNKVDDIKEKYTKLEKAVTKNIESSTSTRNIQNNMSGKENESLDAKEFNSNKVTDYSEKSITVQENTISEKPYKLFSKAVSKENDSKNAFHKTSDQQVIEESNPKETLSSTTTCDKVPDETDTYQNIVDTDNKLVSNQPTAEQNSNYEANLEKQKFDTIESSDDDSFDDANEKINSEPKMKIKVVDLFKKKSKPIDNEINVSLNKNISECKLSSNKDKTSINQDLSIPSRENIAKTMKGRSRKLTPKAQEFFTHKTSAGSSLTVQKENLSGISLDSSFEDDGSSIGKYCQKGHITISLLNSGNKASSTITNGIIYDLYHFFKIRNAKLTALVHTIYRLKGLAFEKSSIISIMASIHEMIKVSWDENLKKNSNFPNQEFNFTNQEIKKRKYESTSTLNSRRETNKKMKRSSSHSSEPPNLHLVDSQPVIKHAADSNINDVPKNDVPNSSRSFDLNVTQGCDGKITRGDIVYLYTRWLKKKMEGQTKVFVTDLSSDVDELINKRNVGPIRIPVGTLMSTSVKIFEEFRRLSKVNMEEAKSYLLNNWIEDINSLLNPSIKNSVPEVVDKNCGIKPNEMSKEKKDEIPCIASKEKKDEVPCIASKEELPQNNVSVTSSESIIETNNPDGQPKATVKEKVVSTIAGTDVPNSIEEYDVEKIVGYRIVKIGDQSITEYRVRWAGFSSQDDSWVNVVDLQCPEILADFWKALNKQRALKNISPLKVSDSMVKDKIEGKSLEVNTNRTDQENLSPFFGIDTGGYQKFFKLLISNLNSNQIDYHCEGEEEDFVKRVKVSKKEVLCIYDHWRLNNQERLLAGGNSAINVEELIDEIKELMDSKKVRNFNPNCLIDACYRMSLMKEKLKDNSTKLAEYLAGDFMELAGSSKKHQDFVRKENEENLKKHKIEKSMILAESESNIDQKVSQTVQLEREALNIAKFLKDHNLVKSSEFESFLKNEVSAMKKIEQLSNIPVEFQTTLPKSLKVFKEQNKIILEEIRDCGVSDDALDDLLSIVLRKC